MGFSATVVYPNDDDIKFDLDYYLKTHMPLVKNTWGKHGLEKWEVIKFAQGPDGSKPKYAIEALLTFKDGAALQAAMADEGTKAVFDDVPNFTNKQPIFLAGEVVGSD
jgi:uncharacterized protein (TIGR02118 family)